jgi:hypothetical protein
MSGCRNRGSVLCLLGDQAVRVIWSSSVPEGWDEAKSRETCGAGSESAVLRSESAGSPQDAWLVAVVGLQGTSESQEGTHLRKRLSLSSTDMQAKWQRDAILPPTMVLYTQELATVRGCVCCLSSGASSSGQTCEVQEMPT